MPDDRLDRLNIVPIEDPADPRIADYADLRDADLRRRGSPESGGLFIAEGEGVVRQLVGSRYRTRSVLLTPTRLRTAADALALLPAGTPIFVLPQEAMNRTVGFNIHRGILAAADRGPPADWRPLADSAPLLVVLEDLANHDNIGGVFRNVAALAPTGAAVLLSPRCADPLYRKAIRVSMGHVLRTPFALLEPWPQALAELRRQGFVLIALTPSPDALPIGEVIQAAGWRPALILGAEGSGLSEAVLAMADRRVRIPMAPGVDSLNVATAAAIALHRLGGSGV